MGVGTGVLRVINIDKETVANMVPVDFVVNGLIVCAWKTHENFRLSFYYSFRYGHMDGGFFFFFFNMSLPSFTGMIRKT